MNTVQTIQMQERRIDRLREELANAREGMSLRSVTELQRDLETAEDRLKAMLSGRCKPGEAA